MQEFWAEGGGSCECLRGPFFKGGDKILILGEALKFGVIFPKVCMKINKTMENNRGHFRKMQTLYQNFY